MQFASYVPHPSSVSFNHSRAVLSVKQAGLAPLIVPIRSLYCRAVFAVEFAITVAPLFRAILILYQLRRRGHSADLRPPRLATSRAHALIIARFFCPEQTSKMLSAP